jgi:hypothetical protein
MKPLAVIGLLARAKKSQFSLIKKQAICCPFFKKIGPGKADPNKEEIF